MVYGQVFYHQSNEEDLVNINVGGIQHFHALEELCVFCFMQEMEYWRFCELDLHACCLDWFLERKDEKEENWVCS